MKTSMKNTFAPSLIAAATLVLICFALTAVAADGGDDWLTVGPEAGELRLDSGIVVEFEGSGSLAFGTDRHRVTLPATAGVRIAGEAAPGGRRAGSDEVVEVTGPGGETAWRIRRIDDPSLLAGDGTRIRDDQPTEEARVDSDEPTRFYLRIDESGGSLFFYPEEEG